MVWIVAAVEVGCAHVEQALLLHKVHDDEAGAVPVGQQAEGSVQSQARDLKSCLQVNSGVFSDRKGLKLSLICFTRFYKRSVMS